MKTIIILRGLPGSGKTTWANHWVQQGDKRVRINRDDIRYALFGRYTDVDENLVTKTHNAAMQEAMRTHYDIVLDNMHLNTRSLRDTLTYIKKQGGYQVEIVDMETSLADCIQRDSLRERVVGADIITSLHDKYMRG